MSLTPTREQFRELARPGTLVPVHRDHVADMETPVSALSRFLEDENVFLLESVEGGERWARYSFIGIHPYALFTVENGRARLFRNGAVEDLTECEKPFFALRDVLQRARPVPVPGLPRFFAGAVGYVSYETVRQFEQIPEPQTPLEWPEVCMMLTDEMAIFDNVRHTVKVVVCARIGEGDDADAAYDDACERIARIEERLREPRPEPVEPAHEGPVRLESNMTPEQFHAMVRRAKEYIVEGDIIQAVLSQRFSGPLPASPFSVYRALRLVNPSPYMFFLQFGRRRLIGSSPEVMVRLVGNRAELRPIAGTRPRGETEQQDRQLADELLADEKERAEHVMLVDLGRNDLGRVSRGGSVQVQDFMVIERYSHVMHIVSNVSSELLPETDAFDLVAATFPAGTLSGAPKIRAMEIVNELEPASRGPYGGAVGYIGYDGNMDMAITIRTLEVDGDRVAVQAGAGIVYDSDPETEDQETRNKARGMIQALETAARGL